MGGRRANAAAVVLCLGMFAPATAAAHDISYDLRGTGDVRVAFHYSDGSPMAAAAFQVFAPNETLPKASGSTDGAGELAFHAGQDGLWRVEVGDASGHTNRARINVAQGWPDTAGRAVPGWLTAISLVLNILLGLLLFRRLKARA